MPLFNGWEALGHVVLVDQSILGKTPRSNPAVYIGAFEHLRAFFAQSEPPASADLERQRLQLQLRPGPVRALPRRRVSRRSRCSS